MKGTPSGRPPTGLGHYLRDLTYGALDGAITTFAVVAGAEGASLGAGVAIVLGLANLGADGISMGASNYLGLKSAIQQEGGSVKAEKPLRHGFATFAAFAVVGAVPLLAFLVPGPTLATSGGLALIALFGVGALRARFVQGAPVLLGLEMAVIGGLAGAAAYLIGMAVRGLVL